ncbi:restriction endonuclease subunit S [Pectobacterium carotovorum]|uniref:Restriction endonuclease subunit S n=1 Tax=Pectobacterium carotovorum TaxID=554 RepID=A0A419AVF2_PECCA|nr:restriction endonuclease subunit S [Pectobacterium carotovorum]RJL50800.1 restriction endonuclease subunit S [Pectobacterium carotovorum]
MTVEKLITDHIDIWSSALQTRSTAGRGSNGKIDLYGIKKLRELILELAVRGKLVPQDPNDEPASELLKRIAAEKTELLKQGKIKKQKPLPEISEDEKPFELPAGWEWTRLSDISEYIQRGKGPKYAEHGSVKVVSQKCVQWNGFKLEQSRWITDESIHSYTKDRFLKDGDVLWNSTGAGGTAGRVIYLPEVKEKLVVDSHVTLIRTVRDNGKFISNYISTYGIQQRFDPKHSNTLLSGTTNQAELNSSVVNSFLVPFPPQKEQERINDKAAELMSLCDKLEQQSLTSLDAHQQLVETLLATLTESQNAEELAESWARISQHFDTLFTTEASIDTLKQTILQLAVMGKLVPQDANDEPASELLKRIEQEKLQLVKEGKIKKQKSLPPVSDEEKPFELPQGWKWCRLAELVTIKGGKRVSNGYKLLTEPTPYVYIRVADMKDGTIDLSDLKYIDEEMHQKIKNYIITKDDIYMTIVGATIGKCGTVPALLDGMNLTENAARLIPSKLISKDYLYLCLRSDLCQEQFIDKTMQVGVQKMALNRLANTLIALPPTNESLRIRDRVKEINKLCSKLVCGIIESQQTQLHLADALTDAALN